jgi:hypothetical protein
VNYILSFFSQSINPSRSNIEVDRAQEGILFDLKNTLTLHFSQTDEISSSSGSSL